MTTATEWGEDHFIAGHLALDFANTVYRRWPETGADLFTDTDALAAWFARAGVLPDNSARARVTETTLTEARTLRALLWTVLDVHRDGRRPLPTDAFAGLLDTARHSVTDLTLRPDGSTSAHTPRGALAVVTLAGIMLVLNPPPRGVRACDRCGWFFIDSSRGRRRRWCSMKTCGNQAKVARHRSARP
ncbi:CGNR zinc finger domain-containing protein [Streptomyces sp. DSM 44915]|uniref:CGNR zinc finger domain-containing protein n=1 Tax=Streptomyces chisholmiae TaxID=3075540 RepID=A0ABU2JVU6_9ACTN|nr:ABATE domain-containing protein [Streptomyces sp. DSM 44915]MDT0269060.1 CGNR zinc finger domain-containing protein [Streptomyces sp. DSM 44915]